jgi:L-fucose isomerase-like protein
MVKLAAKPRILEGKRIVIFGKPFDSSSASTKNLNADIVYKRTGVRLQYRPIEDLPPLLANVDEAAARKEMERWKKEAAEVVDASDQAILDASRLYVLLRSIIDQERLSAISIDCLGFSFDSNPMLPYPCLAFARLRDEGIAAACEADVCGMLSTMLFQEISRKSSYFANVASVNPESSSIVLNHCIAPLKLLGADAAPLAYKLRDYHGFMRGVVPQVEFPTGIEVMTGSFSKDLKSFVLWPGKILSGIEKEDKTSSNGFMRVNCANHAEVKIKDVGRFLQNIAGIHHIMVAGNYTEAVNNAMLRMNVTVVGPSDFTAP